MEVFETKILKPTVKNVKLAAQEIMKGNLVGMPTETVYGLGANAFNSIAVAKIFEAKNRPQDNPLIVHVYKDYDLMNLVKDVPPMAQKLLNAFTPGPLTLVFNSKGNVSPLVSRGLDTIAVRIPDNDAAQKFLKQCNVPIAAPSANISTHMSATTAKEVKEELDGKLPIILDGGKCSVGIESTVVDVRGKFPIILRPGRITKEMINELLGKVEEITKVADGQKVASPGMKYKHYAPKCPVIMADVGHENLINAEYDKIKAEGYSPVILCLNQFDNLFKNKNKLSLGNTVQDYTKNIYSSLRKAEKKHDYIFIIAVPKENIGGSLMNRLNKVCGGNII